MEKPSEKSRETFVGRHITGPLADAVTDIAGDILSWPVRAADKLIDKGIAGVRDAIKSVVSGLPVFPVTTGKK